MPRAKKDSTTTTSGMVVSVHGPRQCPQPQTTTFNPTHPLPGRTPTNPLKTSWKTTCTFPKIQRYKSFWQQQQVVWWSAYMAQDKMPTNNNNQFYSPPSKRWIQMPKRCENRDGIQFMPVFQQVHHDGDRYGDGNDDQYKHHVGQKSVPPCCKTFNGIIGPKKPFSFNFIAWKVLHCCPGDRGVRQQQQLGDTTQGIGE